MEDNQEGNQQTEIHQETTTKLAFIRQQSFLFSQTNLKEESGIAVVHNFYQSVLMAILEQKLASSLRFSSPTHSRTKSMGNRDKWHSINIIPVTQPTVSNQWRRTDSCLMSNHSIHNYTFCLVGTFNCKLCNTYILCTADVISLIYTTATSITLILCCSHVNFRKNKYSHTGVNFHISWGSYG